MTCRICGNENAELILSKRQALCAGCARSTPVKASRSTFDHKYWNNDPTVPECIKREFYSDYLASTFTVDQYINSTVETDETVGQ